MSDTATHVTIDLDDVMRYGSVEAAILAWAENSDDTASGAIGPQFSTSGPGPGWSKTHDASDFAERALDSGYGAMYYLDAEDGRLAELVDDDRPVKWAGTQTVGEYRDACPDCIGEPTGNETWLPTGSSKPQVIEWTDASVVCLQCPPVEDALAHPQETASMARAVIDTHGACSDKGEWRQLVESIRAAAEALEDIDTDNLDD